MRKKPQSDPPSPELQASLGSEASSNRNVDSAAPAAVASTEAATGSVAGGSILSSHPGFLIRRLHQLSVAIFMQETAGFDITPVQYGVIAVVDANPGIDQVSTALAVGVDRTTIVGVVNRLEKKGLISRAVSPVDRRARLLSTTDAGKNLLHDLKEAADNINARLLEPFWPGEGAFFREQVLRLIQHHEQSGVGDAIESD